MIRTIPLALSLAACAQQTPAPAPASPAGSAGSAAPGTQCDANALGALVGQPAEAVVVKAQQQSGAKTVRRYETGAMLTMDFRADRLNIETDAAGKVVKFSCG